MKKRLVFGWLLILIGILPILTFIFTSKVRYAIWFSNHTFLILGIAVLFNSRFWILAEFCLGWIAELAWSIDYIYRLFTGDFLWGLTRYMFTDDGGFNWTHLYSLQHILFIPVAIIALIYLSGPIKNAWIGSLAHFVILASISFQFSYVYNLNCVYQSCTSLTIPHYMIAWPLIKLAQVFTSYLMVYGIFMIFSHKNAGAKA